MQSEKDKIREELEKWSPRLSALKQQSAPPFRVPDHYFHRLTNEIMEQVSLEPQPARPARGPRRLTGLWALLSPRLAAGLAAVTVLLIAAVLWLRPAGGERQAPPATELTTEEMTDYIAAHIDEFELEMLAAAAGGETATPRENEELDRYLDEIIDDLELEDLEELF